MSDLLFGYPPLGAAFIAVGLALWLYSWKRFPLVVVRKSEMVAQRASDRDLGRRCVRTSEGEIQVRLCPTNAPTFDVFRSFLRVPMRGESIIHDDRAFVVVDIDWDEDGRPLIVAHSADRRRAQMMLGNA